MKRLTAARLARVILRYRRREDGRALHCQIDDWNMDNQFFDDESVQMALAYKDWSGARLIRLMGKMTRTQRLKANGLANGDPYELRPQFDVVVGRRR